MAHVHAVQVGDGVTLLIKLNLASLFKVLSILDALVEVEFSFNLIELGPLNNFVKQLYTLYVTKLNITRFLEVTMLYNLLHC